MDEIINKIIEHNKELFGDDFNVEKINVGFTNAIYKVNNSFIVKICNDIDNEDKLKKEIDFYKANATNNLIPKLYYSNTEKLDVPCFYEILEKIEGVTLYNVWHTFSEEQREDIIRQLCDAMKQMHSNIGEKYDWTQYNKNKFNILFEEAKNKGLLNEEEVEVFSVTGQSLGRYANISKASAVLASGIYMMKTSIGTIKVNVK